MEAPEISYGKLGHSHFRFGIRFSSQTIRSSALEIVGWLAGMRMEPRRLRGAAVTAGGAVGTGLPQHRLDVFKENGIIQSPVDLNPGLQGEQMGSLHAVPTGI